MDERTRLREGGVVGGGGAGFPTWKKLETPVENLIVNAAECEPLLKSDQFLMITQPDDLIRGAVALAKLCGARNCIVALKEHYVKPRAALEKAVRDSGLPVRLCLLPSVYPAGDEQAVVRYATGRVVPPLALPASVGSTVVSVSTTLNALAALAGESVTRRLVTVCGEAARPGLYWVPVGTRAWEVARLAGVARSRGLRMVIGGPMMGRLVAPEQDPVVEKTCGGLLILPAEHPLVLRADAPLEHLRARARSCCIQCRACTDLCPRYLLGQPLAPHLVMRGFARGASPAVEALLCVECGVCEAYACPMGLSPRRVQAMLKPELRAMNAQPDRALYPRPEALRLGRQVPGDRLAARLGVARYDMPLPEHAVEIKSTRVYIPMRQHIGAPCAPCVCAGERVREGQAVGLVPQGALGAAVHASIAGVVRAADAAGVLIEEE